MFGHIHTCTRTRAHTTTHQFNWWTVAILKMNNIPDDNSGFGPISPKEPTPPYLTHALLQPECVAACPGITIIREDYSDDNHYNWPVFNWPPSTTAGGNADNFHSPESDPQLKVGENINKPQAQYLDGVPLLGTSYPVQAAPERYYTTDRLSIYHRENRALGDVQHGFQAPKYRVGTAQNDVDIPTEKGHHSFVNDTSMEDEEVMSLTLQVPQPVCKKWLGTLCNEKKKQNIFKFNFALTIFEGVYFSQIWPMWLGNSFHAFAASH